VDVRPTLYVLDREGVIRYKALVGFDPFRAGDLERAVERLATPGGDAQPARRVTHFLRGRP
jgi:hypothetical protein